MQIKIAIPSTAEQKRLQDVQPGLERSLRSTDATVCRFPEDRMPEEGGELPVFYFIVIDDSGKRILIDSTGKLCLMGRDEDRPVRVHTASVQYGDPSTRRLDQCKPGGCFLFDEKMYMLVERPDKTRDRKVYAVAIDGSIGRTFDSDREMEVYENVRISITP